MCQSPAADRFDPDCLHRWLVAHLLCAPAQLIWIHALPGSGAGRLMRAFAGGQKVATVWPSAGPVDLPPAHSPLRVGEATGILRARPGQIADLDLLRRDGRVVEIGNRDLFLRVEQDPHFEQSGGWPALSRHFAGAPGDEAGAVALLRDLLAPLPGAVRAVLRRLARAPAGLEDAGQGPETRAVLAWLDPLAEPRGGHWLVRTATLRRLLAAALAGWPDMPAEGGGAAETVLAALAMSGPGAALAQLRAEGGLFFLHLHGPEAAERVLAGLGDGARLDPDLVGLAFLAAAKAGHVERAAHLLAEAGPPGLIDLSRPLSGPPVAPQLGFCRIMLAIYRSDTVRQHILSEASALLGAVAPDQLLLRGGIYNAVLELQIRAGAHCEAAEMAARALAHYEQAGAPYLSFYIHVHRAVIVLRDGRPGEAAPHLDRAAAALAELRFDVPQDRRFLELLRAVADYETGDPGPMARFAEQQARDFAFGEIWPSIAAMALAYGAEALMQLRGLEAATGYLERWRVQVWRTRRFQILIEQREVALLQGAGRWREARLRLEGMAMRIGRLWMDSSGENLADLRALEDLRQAMIWMRQQVYEQPRHPALMARLAALRDNPALSTRDRLCLEIWTAFAARRTGALATAKATIAELLEASARRRHWAPALEERGFLMPLVEDRRLGGAAAWRVRVPEAVRCGAVPVAPSGEFSGQEWRCLLLLAEGCPNKEIARQLRVSLPTVKFHLRNLYTRLGVGGRQAAVAEARRRGHLPK